MVIAGIKAAITRHENQIKNMQKTFDLEKQNPENTSNPAIKARLSDLQKEIKEYKDNIEILKKKKHKQMRQLFGKRYEVRGSGIFGKQAWIPILDFERQSMERSGELTPIQ